MLLQRIGRGALVALVLLTAGVAIAEDAEKPKEIPHPALPQGAGKIDEKAPKTFTETKSGLKYRILREGKGMKPTADQSVDVNYHGWLDNREVFDSSYKRGKSLSFPLKAVIPGWTEGMQLVGEGGMIELEIPSKLGYGANGAGNVIPPNATLHFLVELIEVK
jgi:FKBP-type peptidyl-prolyl cis-trans isomerase